jgi:hypothetical protein
MRRWWPANDDFYWPFETDEVDIPTFVRAFEGLGYKICENENFEPGFEKVAIYARSNGDVQHAARQLSDGTWTSKMGMFYWPDINHYQLDVVAGLGYGSPAKFLIRRRQSGLIRLLRYLYYRIRIVNWETVTFVKWLIWRGDMYNETP